jgi:hypothetical protein
MITAPTIELINKVPAVTTRRSQPGSAIVNTPPELLPAAVALGPEPGEVEVAVVLTL